MKKKNRIVLVALSVIVVLVIGAVVAVTAGLSEGENVMVAGIDLSDTIDGDYVGSYEQGRWSNTLTVHVKDHRIMGIDIDKDVFAPSLTNCSNEVFRRVMEKQDTRIDAVSGATVTTKAYLKAVENALEK